MSAHAAVLSDVAPILAHLTERTGLSFSGHRPTDLRQTLRRAMQMAEVDDARSFVDLLERGPDRLDALVDDLTIGETHFFREPGHLELLTGRILPELLQARPPHHRLQLWSAGCATGEEPYTLAILLEEAGLADEADVLGTDISAAALRRAEQATYRSWSLRGVSEWRLERYFDMDDERARLTRRVVRRVDLRRLNLVVDPYPSPDGGLDVIFCRNVLIYLTPPAIDLVVRRLVGALADGGWLVTSSSDPHLGSVDGLETVVTREGVAYWRISGSSTDSDRTREPRHHTAAMRARRRRAGDRPKPAVADPSPPPDPPRWSGTTDRPAEPQRDGASAASGTDPDGPTSDGPRPALTALARVRALADAGTLEEALAAVDAAAQRWPTEAQVHHLRSVLLLTAQRWTDTAAAAAAALYLDPTLAVAEIVRGRALLALGDRRGATRGFRNARRLLVQQPVDEPVRFADGASAGRLLAELDRLDRPLEAGR